MTSLELQALSAVEEMRRLGAILYAETGADGNLSFVWRAKPAPLRDAVALYWNELPKPPGLREAMARIIRHQASGDVL